MHLLTSHKPPLSAPKRAGAGRTGATGAAGATSSGGEVMPPCSPAGPSGLAMEIMRPKGVPGLG